MKKTRHLLIFLIIYTFCTASYSSIIEDTEKYLPLVLLRGVNINKISDAQFNYLFILGQFVKEHQYIELSLSFSFNQIEARFELSTSTFTTANLSNLLSGCVHYWRIMEDNQMISVGVGSFMMP